jgi:hypothetical protein
LPLPLPILVMYKTKIPQPEWSATVSYGVPYRYRSAALLQLLYHPTLRIIMLESEIVMFRTETNFCCILGDVRAVIAQSI